jgi:hypothetical protein
MEFSIDGTSSDISVTKFWFPQKSQILQTSTVDKL